MQSPGSVGVCGLLPSGDHFWRQEGLLARCAFMAKFCTETKNDQHLEKCWAFTTCSRQTRFLQNRFSPGPCSAEKMRVRSGAMRMDEALRGVVGAEVLKVLQNGIVAFATRHFSLPSKFFFFFFFIGPFARCCRCQCAPRGTSPWFNQRSKAATCDESRVDVPVCSLWCWKLPTTQSNNVVLNKLQVNN